MHSGRTIFRTIGAGALLVALAGCVTPAGPTGTGLAAAPAAQVDDTVYVARQDGTFNIPAIPLEKLPREYQRQTVDFPTSEAPGTVIINPAQRHLYFVTGDNKAIRYGIAVGRAGFEWAGIAQVTGRKTWPTWTPPPEMIQRKPELAKWEKGQPGGPENPLGARALYLTTDGRDYGYRIHGTPEWDSIGHNASSGCIRMINQDIIDLYSRVPDGAKVVVLTADGQVPSRIVLPPPQTPKIVKVEAPEPDPIAPAAVEAQAGSVGPI